MKVLKENGLVRCDYNSSLMETFSVEYISNRIVLFIEAGLKAVFLHNGN